jgi:two-component system phosphate regulon response regulator PhoB
MMAEILIIEDDEGMAETLQINLRHHGHQPRWARSVEAAQALLAHPDGGNIAMLLLDWMLPGKDGLSYTQMIRRATAMAHLPILMLTAKSSETDRVMGLEAGADDYLCKPFSMKELNARITALLRRVQPTLQDGALEAETTPLIVVGKLVINACTRKASLAQEVLTLTELEFRLLAYLAQFPRVHSRSALLDQVWGREKSVDLRTVDVTIKRLRQAMTEVRSASTVTIETVRGVGYRLVNLPS